MHRVAVVLSKLNLQKPTIAEHLFTAKRKEMKDNRFALHKIFTSILYLSKQGLALRGHEENKSNLQQLLTLRSKDILE